MTDFPPTLSEIWVYPVKSLGGVKLSTAQVEERGLQWDRNWLIVDENGVFLTQREHNNMALIGVAINADGLEIFNKNNSQDCIQVPFDPVTDHEKDIKIWKDRLTACTVSDEADKWLSVQLGRKVQLVKLPKSSSRLSPPGLGSVQKRVSFADDFPFLLISEASLADLNSRLAHPVTMDRFRPNFVVAGTLPFEEDSWKNISISGIDFEVVSPCERCVVVTVNQQTGHRSPEPLKTLAGYRRSDKKIRFGQNVIGLGTGTVSTGDSIMVIEADQ
ncbi:MOSC domain-containing protein [Dyadobacter sp.]|uniref:MOSC domain-containing protein n=1 Tax=Dyadobacter sp. TaxID=1914288 RepID=UPI003F6FCC1C